MGRWRLTHRAIVGIWIVAMVVASFLALCAFAIPVNSYVDDTGVTFGVDCDGPLEVMMFAIPSLMLYSSAMIFFLVRALRSRRVLHIVPGTAAALICIGLVIQTGLAIAAQHRNETINTDVCGHYAVPGEKDPVRP